jgi:hypothetical protein
LGLFFEKRRGRVKNKNKIINGGGCFCFIREFFLKEKRRNLRKVKKKKIWKKRVKFLK